MKLHSIHLSNYRGHKDLTIPLGDGFNVVVGVNGSGKTSVLKAVCDLLSGLVQFMNVNSFYQAIDQSATHIKFEKAGNSYRFEPQYPVKVSTMGTAFGKTLHWTVIKKSQVDQANYEGEAPGVAWHQRQIHPGQAPGPIAQNADTLPIALFYRADRSWPQSQPNELVAATQRTSRSDAYTNWANASLDAAALQSWVVAKCLERFQTSSENSIPFDDVQNDELSLVNKALEIAIEGIKGLRYDIKQKSLLVEWLDEKTRKPYPIAFENLSDGQRAVVGLIADIARRMCILNPHLKDDAIAETAGVILIDELDMHLHPKWQRILVNGLKKAFPKVQFITASHSPQILGELSPDEIILLCPGGISHPQASYGLSSSQVLEEIMDAKSRTKDVEEKLADLFTLLEANDLSAAKQALHNLKIIAPDIPELAGAESLLKRKEILGR